MFELEHEIRRLRIHILNLTEDQSLEMDFDSLMASDFEIFLAQWNLKYFEKQYDRF